MNREILFRGKCVYGGNWTSGTLYAMNGKPCIVVSTFFDYWKETAAISASNKVDPATVGQYTGLCDKNGVKIFEGDIIAAQGSKELVVEWFAENASFLGIFKGSKSHSDDDDDDCCAAVDFKYYEIVGNIHDNQEVSGV